MMKFSRSYERSILVYRQTGPEGRILLSLGRTFEDGECKSDNPKDIPEDFELLSYIITRDPAALLKDITARFSEYLDPEHKTTFRGAVFDALKLRERITSEQEVQGGSEMLRGLEMVYGKQVMEIIFAATFGNDGRRTGTLSQGPATSRNPDAPSRFGPLAITAFVAIVMSPVLILMLLRPDLYTAPPEPERTSVLLSYNGQDSMSTLASRQVDTSQQALAEDARARKEQLYFMANFGTLSESMDYTRPIPGRIAPGDIVTQDEVDQESDSGGALPSLASQMTDTGGAGDQALDDVAQTEGTPGKISLEEQDAVAPEENSLIAEGGTANPATTPEDADPAANDQAQPETDVFAFALASSLASAIASNASEKALPHIPGWPDVRADFGLPDQLAQFRIRGLDQFDASDLVLDIRGFGVTATYDIARNPPTIFEVVRGDLAGLAASMDETVAAVCTYIDAQSGPADTVAPEEGSAQEPSVSPASESLTIDAVASALPSQTPTEPTEPTLRSVNLALDLGRSTFIATAIDAAICESAEYTIFPMFEIDPLVE